MRLRKRRDRISGPSTSNEAGTNRQHKGTANRASSKTIEDIVLHYSIAEAISEELRPLDEKDPLYDLSHLTRSSQALYHAFAPFLYRRVNLTYLKNWTLPLFKIHFFERGHFWRPYLYLMVQSLQVREFVLPPFKSDKPLVYFLELAGRLPNLRRLILPFGIHSNVEIDYTRWNKVEELQDGLGQARRYTPVDISSVKVLRLPVDFANAVRSRQTTKAWDIYLYGHLRELYEPKFDWKAFAPNAKRVQIYDKEWESHAKHRGWYELIPWYNEAPTLPARFFDMALEEYSIYVGNGAFQKEEFYTPFGWIKSLPTVARSIIENLEKEKHYTQLKTLKIGIQIVKRFRMVSDNLRDSSFEIASPAGTAIHLAEQYSRDWQRTEFAHWRICTAQKGDDGVWAYAEAEKLIWKNEANYPFGF